LTNGDTFRYAGRELDSETGLYSYRARYFDPQVGRFISEDPIRFAGGINFYRYTGNNLIDYNDPFGLWTGQLGISGGVAGAGGSFGGAVSIVVDGQGNIGIALTYGFGLGQGVGGGIGVQGAVSNAVEITDLNGPFAALSATGGDGAIGSADYFHGPSPHGQVTGVGGTVGLGGGAFSSQQLTNTLVIPIGSLAHPPTSTGCHNIPGGGFGTSPMNDFVNRYGHR
jgi:RHS repeat-associated protein